MASLREPSAQGLGTVYGLSDEQVASFASELAKQWWCKGRTLQQLTSAIQQSITVGLQSQPDGTVVAYARVISDKVFKALIIDLVVIPEYRGKGVGHKLVQAILHHPELDGVLDFELYCAEDLEGWYNKLGFSRPSNGVLFLRRRSSEQATQEPAEQCAKA